MSDDRFDEELRARLHGLVDDAEPAPGFRQGAERGADGYPQLLRWGLLAAAAAVVLTLIGVVTLRGNGTSERHLATRPGPATSTSTEPAPIAGGAAEETSTTSAAAGASATTTTAKKRATSPPTTAKSPPTTAPAPGPRAANGKIAFVSDRSGQDEVWVMYRDGSGQTQLTHGGGDWPAWSPDGAHIAYSTRSGIFVVNADGTGTRQVTPATGMDSQMSWSPDGAQLVFNQLRSNGNAYPYSDLWVVNADGSGLRQLTSDQSTTLNPQWAPDGTLIAFYRGGPNSPPNDIYVMRPDGTDVRSLHTLYGGAPSWSPDSQRIAFTPGSSSTTDVYVINRDGSGKNQITNDNANDFTPAWSPDGQWIAYASNRGGNMDVYLVHPDGSGQRQLTNDPKTDWEPSWQPVTGAP